MNRHICLRCGHRWESELISPASCRNCKSVLWCYRRVNKPGQGRKAVKAKEPTAQTTPAKVIITRVSRVTTTLDREKLEEME